MLKQQQIQRQFQVFDERHSSLNNEDIELISYIKAGDTKNDLEKIVLEDVLEHELADYNKDGKIDNEVLRNQLIELKKRDWPVTVNTFESPTQNSYAEDNNIYLNFNKESRTLIVDEETGEKRPWSVNTLIIHENRHQVQMAEAGGLDNLQGTKAHIEKEAFEEEVDYIENSENGESRRGAYTMTLKYEKPNYGKTDKIPIYYDAPNQKNSDYFPESEVELVTEEEMDKIREEALAFPDNGELFEQLYKVEKGFRKNGILDEEVKVYKNWDLRQKDINKIKEQAQDIINDSDLFNSLNDETQEEIILRSQKPNLYLKEGKIKRKELKKQIKDNRSMIEPSDKNEFEEILKGLKDTKIADNQSYNTAPAQANNREIYIG